MDRRARLATPYDRSRSPSGDWTNHLVGHFGVEDGDGDRDEDSEDCEDKDGYSFYFGPVVYVDTEDKDDRDDWNYCLSVEELLGKSEPEPEKPDEYIPEE